MRMKLRSGQSRVVLVLSMVFPALLMAPATTAAKEDRDRDRHDFYGWVEVMPEGLHGTWIVGGQKVTTNSQTEFD